jgi:hypothetical protein
VFVFSQVFFLLFFCVEYTFKIKTLLELGFFLLQRGLSSKKILHRN